MDTGDPCKKNCWQNRFWERRGNARSYKTSQRKPSIGTRAIVALARTLLDSKTCANLLACLQLPKPTLFRGSASPSSKIATSPSEI
jgi:hypothetical protein